MQNTNQDSGSLLSERRRVSRQAMSLLELEPWQVNKRASGATHCVSPVGFMLLLGTMRIGAKGRKRADFDTFFGHPLMAKNLDLAGIGGQGESLLIAKALRSQEGLQLLEECERAFKQKYRTTAQACPLHRQTALAAKTINSWMKESTLGLVGRVAGEGSKRQASLEFSSALYNKFFR